MDYMTILSMLAKAAPGILSNIKAEKARLQGEVYLKEKYHLATAQVNVGYTMRLMETAYSIEWEKTLFNMLKEVQSARSINLELSEVCADIYIMVSVLKYGPPRLDTDGNHRLGYYSYIKPLKNSQTYECIQDLARGRGGDVTLQIVQKELRQWCTENALNLEKH